MLREGGVIADGYDAELDELRALQTNCGDSCWLEARERERTGIANSGSNTTACTASTSKSAARQADKVPDDYRRRQTLKNAERYITPELKAFEDKALSARERALAREKAAVRRAAGALAAAHRRRCSASPRAWPKLDVLASLAERRANARLLRARNSATKR